jgi:hypothetical protein
VENRGKGGFYSKRGRDYEGILAEKSLAALDI